MKNYTALIVDGSPCCQYVNRNRHDVDLSVSVRGGKRHHCNCGWCGQRVEVDADDINPLDFSFEYDDNPDVRYEYEGVTYIGKDRKSVV